MKRNESPKILYAISRDNKTGDVELTVFEGKNCATMALNPPMARQLARLLTHRPRKVT